MQFPPAFFCFLTLNSKYYCHYLVIKYFCVHPLTLRDKIPRVHRTDNIIVYFDLILKVADGKKTILNWTIPRFFECNQLLSIFYTEFLFIYIIRDIIQHCYTMKLVRCGVQKKFGANQIIDRSLPTFYQICTSVGWMSSQILPNCRSVVFNPVLLLSSTSRLISNFGPPCAIQRDRFFHAQWFCCQYLPTATLEDILRINNRNG
jgi:hypothetical protein